MSDKEIDEVSGTETTGHEWDGIKELNTPLPRWWLWTFYATIIWAVGYMIAYPAWPLISSATPGLLGYSSRADLATSVASAQADQAVFTDQIAATEVSDIVANDELARFARAGGESAFKVNCSQCHGSGAQGFEGFPNLNDDEWIWGGSVDEIYLTIMHGVRHEPDFDTRFNEMPAYGRDELLSREEIEAVANYTVSLAGGEADASMLSAGETLFTDNCAACHGEQAEGLAELGGPALDNAIWLFGDGSVESIIAQLNEPQHGVMPAWNIKLGETTVKQLAVYVHGLGGGE